MHTNVRRISMAATMTVVALALAAGPAQAAKSTLTLTLGDQSSAINSFSWGASNPGTTHSGGGGGAGKVNVQDLSLTLQNGPMSVTLLKAVSTGQHFPEAGLQFVNGVFTSSLCMQDVLVSSWQTGASAGEERPSDTASFNFARFEYKVSNSAFGFDIVGNTTDPDPC